MADKTQALNTLISHTKAYADSYGPTLKDVVSFLTKTNAPSLQQTKLKTLSEPSDHMHEYATSTGRSKYVLHEDGRFEIFIYPHRHIVSLVTQLSLSLS